MYTNMIFFTDLYKKQPFGDFQKVVMRLNFIKILTLMVKIFDKTTQLRRV